NFSSLYTYCHNSPVNLVDPTGCLASTHTDSIGNVVAVYNDGDLGVYRHKANAEETRKILADEYSATNTSAGGERMGETLEWNSFVNSKSGKPIGEILFGSYLARDEIKRSINALNFKGINPLYILSFYAVNARNGGIFDLKYGRTYTGSQISEGKYISMRDAGNFLAGCVAQKNGLFAEDTYIAYGAFQLAGNDIFSMFAKFSLAKKLGAVGYYGEEPISHVFQRRGYERNIK
ncbi:MAG: hypothetical protein J6C87_06700, partial [Bacteroides sp.]|nr:hypothetical protein [Bacteroides sp.]